MEAHNDQVDPRKGQAPGSVNTAADPLTADQRRRINEALSEILDGQETETD